MPVLVLGVGNTLMRDDGVGVRLMEALAAVEPALPGIEYLDAGTLELPAAAEDRATATPCSYSTPPTSTRTPGDIRCLEGAAMDEFLRTARCSVHEVGVRDLLDIARLTGHLPDAARLRRRPAAGDRLGRDAERAGRRRAAGAVTAARAILAGWLACPSIHESSLILSETT